MQTFVLAGGCFWCLDAVYRTLDGVRDVVSGYTGGRTDYPEYEDVCSGRTGHAEAVKVVFDETVIPASVILDVFFSLHDPRQLNRQGNDVGTQYRSAVFTHSDEQRKIALEVIDELQREDVYGGKIVTQVVPLADDYYPAEAYHQNYFAQHPNQGYCSVVVAPKVSKFRQKFAHRIKA
jgi:peptide-methionine (S)-S-oxide reductase